MNDQDTARLIAAGDPDAAERFVRENYTSVFRLMRHLTGHREDAEDLTQQAFIVARGKMGSYRGGAKLKTWLHRVAFNEFAQWKRRQKPTVRLTAEQAAQDSGYESCVVGESLLAALAALPDKQREAFILFEVDQFPIAEVTQILGVPSGTVKARLFYARRNLRALLEDGQEINANEPQEAIL